MSPTILLLQGQVVVAPNVKFDDSLGTLIPRNAAASSTIIPQVPL